MMANVRLLGITLLASSALVACSPGDDGIGATDTSTQVEAITAVLKPNAGTSVKLNHHRLDPIWTVTRDDEEACGGGGIAGGLVGGRGNFSHLGQTTVSVSAAWDTRNLLSSGQHTPIGPAGGPVAPVLGQASYPYQFHHDPNTGNCAQTVSATGKVVLTAANGDRVFADVVGGETHRLDFIIAGDGIETFTDVSVTGGTGRFEGATGSFTVHLIARLLPTLRFDITLAEIIPGGTLRY